MKEKNKFIRKSLNLPLATITESNSEKRLKEKNRILKRKIEIMENGPFWIFELCNKKFNHK